MKLESLLLVSLSYYWFPVHLGHCSEQPGAQTQTLTPADISEHHEKHLKKRRNDEVEFVSSASEERSLQQKLLIAGVKSSSSPAQASSCLDVNPVTASDSPDAPETVSSSDSAGTFAAQTITDATAAACNGAATLQHDSHLNRVSVGETGKPSKTNIELTGKGANASHMLKDQGGNITPESDPSVPCKDQEEIPTFDEWTKIMMEVENEKSQTHVSNGLHASSKKIQQPFTNYASVECGAKILSSNPEAKSTSAILMENMDMYMLNPCNNKIWFIMELCQPIQVKQLDVANFEIFSSNPKDFLVSISDRYPTNKWVKLGTFHARDERTVQSFPLDEHLFAKYIKMFTKYIKVELLSHFGSEHFCPLSMVRTPPAVLIMALENFTTRVFGTSMMEEYEMNSDSPDRQHFQEDHEDDQPPDFVPLDDKSSKNLIGSAKDALLTMVNTLAANVLGGPADKAAGEGNCSSEDLNVAEVSLLPPVIHSSSASVPVTVVADGLDVNKTEVTSTVTQTTVTERVEPTVSASLPEPPTSERHPGDVPVQTTPDVEQIVTLLPDDDESDQSSDGNLQRVKTDRVNASLSSCSSASSLQEYLLQLCFSPFVIQKRKMKPVSCSQAPIQLPDTTYFVSTIIIPSITQHTAISKAPTSSDSSETYVEILPFAESKLGFESGSLNPEPSLTSDLLKLSTDSLSSEVTHPIELRCLSTTECLTSKIHQQSIDNLIESSEKLLPTSLSHLTVTQTVKSSNDQITTEQSSLEIDILTDTVSVNTVDQSQLASSSTLVDHPVQPSKNKMDTGASQKPTQPINPVDGSLGSKVSLESKSREILDDAFLESNTEPSSEIYTEMQNSSDAPVQGSNQKESVFMRLNNRIKVLEMNMSLSGRYLEQLSQRYRKQVEEMQRAFNQTVIKLQNTSRMAEEQDQKQTDSIQMLQAQLDNVTQLVFSLSVSVGQLQHEVSDRQSYIVLCLVLCVILGLLICLNHHMLSEGPPVESDTSSFSERNVCDYYEDVLVRRRASDPLSQSSFQIPAEAGAEETNSPKQLLHFPVGRKKKHQLRFNKSSENLTSSVLTSPSVANGIPQCTIGPQGLKLWSPESGPHLLNRDVMSDVSSEGSSQSDENFFCGISTCARLCEALPAPKRWTEKKSHKQRLTRTTSEHLHQAPQCRGPSAGFGPTLNLHKH